MSEFNAAIKVMEEINNFGYEAFIVGGYVRDYVMGIESDDIDIATNMPMTEVKEKFDSFEYGDCEEFGVINVRKDDFAFEVAHYRQDIYDSKFGKGASTTENVGSFKEDAKRRDFTINAMAMDKDKNIIDPFNGMKDIENKIIRTVGNAEDRFKEDYIRIMRGIRFASKTGFDIDKDTFEAMRNNAEEMANVSGERIKKEFFKMAGQSGKNFANAFDIMDKTGIMKVVFPEIHIMKGFEQSKIHHPEGDVFSHSYHSIKASTSTDAIINIAIMFHDIGKPDSYKKRIDNGIIKHTYYGHDNIGIKVFKKVADRIRFSNKEKEIVEAVISEHMRFHKIEEMKNSKVRKIIDNPHFEIIKIASKADEMSKGDTWDSGRWERKMEKIQKVKNIGMGFDNFNKIITGKMIMDWMEMTKGSPVIGEIKRSTYNWANDKNVTDETEIINHAKSIAMMIKKRG